jgi:hypothetical protein
MEDGLKRKAVAHQVSFLLLSSFSVRKHSQLTPFFRSQEQLAERSRLAREGLFEPHMTHDALTNLSEEHRDVASGSKVFGGPGEDAAASIADTLKNGGIGKQVLENQKMN